jgi:hypothetical protein
MSPPSLNSALTGGAVSSQRAVDRAGGREVPETGPEGASSPEAEARGRRRSQRGEKKVHVAGGGNGSRAHPKGPKMIYT